MVSIKRPSGRHVSDAALAAVTDDVTEAISRGEFLSIPLILLRPDPDQPRKSFPETMIEERAAQLHEWGQLHPITVKPLRFDDAGNKYYPLIDGECRWRAAKKVAGLDALDAKIDYGAADDATRTLVMQALSNDEGRQPLLPTERASMYAKLVTCYGTQAAAAKALGIASGTFSQVLSINTAPEAVKALATDGIVNDADTLGRLVGVVRKNKKIGEKAIDKIRQTSSSQNGRGGAGESAREIVVRAARSTRQPESPPAALTTQRAHLEKNAGKIVLIVERGRDTHRFALSDSTLAELLASAHALKE